MRTTYERGLVLFFCAATDALLLWFAFSSAALTRLHSLIYLDSMQLLYRDQAACILLFLLAMYLAGAYRSEHVTDRFDSVYYAWIGLALVAAPLLALATVLPEGILAISRRELMLAPLLAALAFVLWRYYLGWLASRFASLHRFYDVLGEELPGRRIASEINDSMGARVDARFVTLDDLRREMGRAQAEGWHHPFRHRNAIITSMGLGKDAGLKQLEFCETHFGRTFIYPSLQDMLVFRQIRLQAIAGIPLIDVTGHSQFLAYASLKRAVDIAIAGAGLLLALPVGVVTACAIKMTSPGPIFYTQERMGLNGRRFKLYKFRSMITEAEAKTGPMWAKANDDRVTPVGRIIRKHRIDEIPQLVNVLKGDMSLIGPRPERPHFHEEFCGQWPLFDKRLSVRPGVTSLSHVLGSYDSEPEDRLRYDLMYISSLSLFTDLKILVATVRVVLGAKGAQ